MQNYQPILDAVAKFVRDNSQKVSGALVNPFDEHTCVVAIRSKGYDDDLCVAMGKLEDELGADKDIECRYLVNLKDDKFDEVSKGNGLYVLDQKTDSWKTI
jgi:hypothetical protein